MIFEEGYRIVYCKDKYDSEYNNKYYNMFKCFTYYKKGRNYFKGYLIHREDGPAIEWLDGSEEWCLNGVYYAKKEFEEIRSLKKKRKILNDI